MWVGQEGYSSIIQHYCMVHYHFGLTMLLSVPVTCWSNLKLLHVSGLKCWSSINKNYCMKPGHRYLLVQSIVHFWLAQIFKILVNSTLQSTSFDYMWSIFADFGTLMSIVFSVISAKKGREDFLNRGGAVPRGRGGTWQCRAGHWKYSEWVMDEAGYDMECRSARKVLSTEAEGWCEWKVDQLLAHSSN